MKTADLSQFRPGNIISDAVFYNSATMTEAQIQSFLASKVSSCRSGYTCLKDYYVQTRSIGASAMCGAYSGGGTERASRVIYKVANACGINPQVLIVMLQKEQGLVTSTAPSSWAYQAAMGQGCPDTAGCDVYYYGFFNQMYGAARQLKIYTVYPKSFNYQAGRTNTIYWHPNASCGTSQVYIENQATANLYIFTPYRPNAAALAAGYGTGDSCSSYGNRNFYNYFTDWFGSTQIRDTAIYAVGSDIYLVSGGVRYHVPASVWSAYRAAFGSPVSVAMSYIADTADGGEATRYLVNTSTSVVAYLDGGQTHRFPTCTLVSDWGGSCRDGLTAIADKDFVRAGVGAEMTSFARLAAGGLIHQISAGRVLIPYFDAAALAAYLDVDSPYAAVMSDTVAATYTVERVRFAPGRLVKQSGDAKVWLPAADGVLLYLGSFGVASDLGLSTAVSSVGAADLAGYARGDALTPFVQCEGALYFAASGLLYPVADGTGFTGLELGADVCAVLEFASDAPAPVFFRPSGSGDVFFAEGGHVRHVTTMTALLELGGGSLPRLLQISHGSLAQLPRALPVPYVPGRLVKQSGDAKVWLPAADGVLLYLGSFGVASDLGLSTAVSSVGAADLAGYARGDALTPFVQCEGALYFAASGLLYPVADGTGFTGLELGADVCAVLEFASDAPAPVFFRPSGSGDVFFAEGGHVRHVTTMTALLELGGGSLPRLLQISHGSLAQLPRGLSIG